MPLVGRKARLSGNASIGVPNRTAAASSPTPARVNGGVNTLPRMDQVGGTNPMSFVFPYGINNVSHEVGSVQFDELSRPLSLPILQPTAATLQKVSFDFLLAAPLDGVSTNIEAQLRMLQNFAAEDDSVIFVNANQMLTQSVASWKISSMSVSISRQNELGQAVSAQVNMSCTESNDSLDRFLTLPKFKYKVNRGRDSGKPGDDPPGNGVAASLINTFFSKVKGGLADKTLTPEERRKVVADLNRLAATYGESSVLDKLSTRADGTYDSRTLFGLVVTDLEARKAGR